MLGASDDVMREILALEQAKKTLSVRELAREDFMVFAKHVYEGFDRQESQAEDYPDDSYGGVGCTVWS